MMDFFIALICMVTFGGVCIAQPVAPTNELIQGPFTVTTEWQTIPMPFDQPLKVIPHVQKLSFLVNDSAYEWERDVAESDYNHSTDRLRRVIDGVVIEPEVILIARSGKTYRAFYSRSGSHVIKLGHFKLIGFGVDGYNGKLFFPKGVEFIAIKVRANAPLKIDHIEWKAPWFYQAPNGTWEDDEIDPSEIVTLQ